MLKRAQQALRRGGLFLLYGALFGCAQPVHADTIDEILHPFWLDAGTQREIVQFVREKKARNATARLMFPPSTILTIRGAAWRKGQSQTHYRIGADLLYHPGEPLLTRPVSSRMPYRARASYYSKTSGLTWKVRANDPLNAWDNHSRTYLVSSENQCQLQQVEITYRSRESWRGYRPRFQSVTLARTIARLRAGQPLHILVNGDSISAGYGSTRLSGISPQQPGYVSLFIQALRRAYGYTGRASEIAVRNLSVAGANAGGLFLPESEWRAFHPDLLVIAFGMNDASEGLYSHRIDHIASFRANIESQIRHARQINPDVDIILIAPMLGNPEWNKTIYPFFVSAPQHPGYASAQQTLYALAFLYPHVAVADITRLWKEIVQAKGWKYPDLLAGVPLRGWYDFSANGVNHPNDFGHRLYAEVLTALLVRENKVR